MTSPSVLLVAGEASGDAHGAELIRALTRQRPGLRYLGCGGAKMKAAGQDQLYDLAEHAVVGLFEVAKHYPRLRRIFHQTLALAEKEHPATVILIDYPGFNLRLASELKRRLPHTRIVYYISPQVWAWKPGRARLMERVIDQLLVILPFEKDWFAKHAPKLPVEWVGHPLLDRLQLDATPQIESGRIALLPGSRAGEIKRHLPILWAAADRLHKADPRRTFLWLSPDEKRHELGQKIIRAGQRYSFPLSSFTGYSFTHLSRCELALVASGTASLECTLVQVPQVVVYRINPLTYKLAKLFMKLPYISLVNLMARTEIVPELVQDNLTVDSLIDHAETILQNARRREEIRDRLKDIIGMLGGPGASERAAAAVLRDLRITT
jgi:lipid-A-disaccharide synthase